MEKKITKNDVKAVAILIEARQWKAARLLLRNYYPAGKVTTIILAVKVYYLVSQFINFPAFCHYHFLKFQISRQSRRMLRLESKNKKMNLRLFGEGIPSRNKFYDKFRSFVKIANSTHRNF